MAAGNRYRTPSSKDIAVDDWVVDTYRGRRRCPQHPMQQMIPMGVTDMCPLDHGEEAHSRSDD
ncbi:hypothetical protein GCM10020295_14510 [Streptomyces cinereospinus]